MKDSKYNNMFSIFPEKMIFHNPLTGETTNHTNLNTSKYDLNNENVYNMEGELISEGGQIIYNTHFILFFYKANVLEVKNFLNHHYKTTPDSIDFLDCIEFGVLPTKDISEGIKGIIRQWVTEKRKEKEDMPGEIKEFVGLVEEIMEHHVSNIRGFLEYKYGSIAENINAQSYWLMELHKHIFWKKREIEDPVLLDRLNWANSWQQELHKQIIIAFNKKINSGNNTTKKEVELQNNPYPMIFVNVHAYLMFQELNELTVNERTKLADYSFIYHSMAKNGLFIKRLRQKNFVDFLNDHCNAELDIPKFPFKNQISKQKPFSTLLSRYKEQTKT